VRPGGDGTHSNAHSSGKPDFQMVEVKKKLNEGVPWRESALRGNQGRGGLQRDPKMKKNKLSNQPVIQKNDARAWRGGLKFITSPR